MNHDIYYANDVFPWAEIPSAWTLSGFLQHRTWQMRRAWGRVIAGTDEQLVAAAKRLDIASAANCGVTQEAMDAFYLWMIKQGRFEELLRYFGEYCSMMLPKDVLNYGFTAGWTEGQKALRGMSGQPLPEQAASMGAA